MFRRLPALMLALGTALILTLAPVTMTPAAGAEARTDIIRAAYTLLMDHFYRVPAPDALLGAAWTGATRTLIAEGARQPLPEPPALPGDRDAAWGAFTHAYAALAALAPEHLSQIDLAFAAVDAMAESLGERHTTFLPPPVYQAFLAQLGGSAAEGVGLGVRLSTRAPWMILELAPDGPAARAGLRPGDTFLAVDGQDVSTVARPALQRALARPEGTPVELLVERPDVGPITITVVVGRFRFPDLQAKVLAAGTGYIRLRSFSSFLRDPSGRPNVIDELDAALAAFESEGVERWVLDLRGNAGGFGYTANALIGRFLPDVVTSRVANQRGQAGEHASFGSPFPVQRPLAVLVDGGSASASEIVASTMQEYGRALIVGTRTAGALAGALLFPLPEGAGLEIAVEEVRTGRGGVLVDGRGVVPDIEVVDDRTPADFAAGRDPQLAAAVAALHGRSVLPAPPPALPGQLGATELRRQLSRYFPPAEEVPATADITAPRHLGDLALSQPSEYVGALGPVPDALGLAQLVRSRGWLGSYSRFYGEVPGPAGPYLSVTVDVYRSQAGAYAALLSNDAPALLEAISPPVQLGDGTVAYRGAWLNAGASILVWRQGRVVITVTSQAVPGRESFEPVVALARAVDARLRAAPLPELAPQPAAP